MIKDKVKNVLQYWSKILYIYTTMTDTGGLNINKTIQILQDIVVKSDSKADKENQRQKIENHGNDLICHRDAKNGINRRCTFSSYYFDEDPFFSDSDEERNYSEIILASQKSFNSSDNMQKIRSAEDQCNLSLDEMKVMEFAKKCTNINISNVSNDFKCFINVCNELQSKYAASPTSEASKNKGISSELSNEISNMNNSTCVPNILTPVLSPKNQSFEDTFLPDRNGNSGGESNGFSHQVFNFDGPSKIGIITNFTVSDEPKVLRRSGRTPKPINKKEWGMFIIGKEAKKSFNKGKVKAKTENRVIKHKSSSKKSSSKVRSENKRKLTNSMNVNKENDAASASSNTTVETNKYGLVSLQPHKTRRLYSAREWLDSDEFKNLYVVERGNFSV